MTTKADDLLRGSVRSGEVSGVVAMATASGSPPYVGAFGARSTVNSSWMTPDTIFQVPGLVRPIMAVAGLQLVDSGVLGIDEPLRTIIPALNQPLVLTGFDRNGTPKLRPARGEITLRRVLNHTAGFNVGSWWDALADLECPWWAPPWAGAVSLLADPGSRWLHCSDTDLIAMIIERASGMTVAEYLHSEIFRELGMLDTGFEVGHRSRARVAGGWRKSDFHAGYTAFYTSPKDYFEFVEAVLWGDESLLSPESFDLLCTNQIGALSLPSSLDIREASTPGEINFYPEIRLHPEATRKWSLGFMVNSQAVPDGPRAGTLTCAGDADSYCWIDRSARTAGALFAQPTPYRPDATESIFGGFQRAIYAERASHSRRHRGVVRGPFDD
ncbi:MAG TPA: serine hydrolase domain-containing protein [Pseudonocardia sp.]|uniref:serine hydrolase domain-containing protein n=1 Tax=Pseudonocardia sp. TaxID=60912 RepID=UPI002C7F9D8C|nr:serine hydrolase domain-containing protein [Pseudonocardia sp.]HTF48082.1 serine hydrolase domain-containing protein [Pseudonocardia sp.]